MMKKLLIVNNNMYIGGIQKALVNLLNCIHDRYDVTLLLFWDSGDYLKYIPDDVKVITVGSAYRYIGMAGYDAKGNLLRFLTRSVWAGLTRVLGRTKTLRLMGISQKKVSGYDVAISYMQNSGEKLFYGGCNDFVLRHVDADKKIAFLHCDFEKCGAATKENKKSYGGFDIVAACSEGCGRSFMSAFPQLASKVKTVYNCHSYDNINELSKSMPELSDEYINILTVARLGREKGVIRGVEAVASLGDLTKRVRYYIIGDGIEKDVICSYIEEHGLSDSVFMLGEMENPYGYMKACDILLIPSYSEGAPMVIGEAAYLGTPTLSTETSSARDMIESTGFGWVCDNNGKALNRMLKTLIDNPAEIRNKQQYLREYDHNNNKAINQFDSLFGEQVNRYDKSTI